MQRLLAMILLIWGSHCFVGKNHLDKASSPYLKQHATNPIHWYPWGDAAFEAALT